MNQTYNSIAEQADKTNKDLKLKGVDKIYVSRTKLGYCKNDGCNNKRRDCSAYCGEC